MRTTLLAIVGAALLVAATGCKVGPQTTTMSVKCATCGSEMKADTVLKCACNNDVKVGDLLIVCAKCGAEVKCADCRGKCPKCSAAMSQANCEAKCPKCGGKGPCSALKCPKCGTSGTPPK